MKSNQAIPISQTRLSSLCKICTHFSTSELDRFNRDVVLRLRTIKETIEEFNQFLPEGAELISYDNVTNHKKHVNVKYIIDQFNNGEVQTVSTVSETSQGQEELEILLNEINATTPLNKGGIFAFLYGDRLRYLMHFQERLSFCQQTYALIPTVELEEKIDKLILTICSLEATLTRDLLSHIRAEVGPQGIQTQQALIQQSQDLLKLMAIQLISHLDRDAVQLVLRLLSTCITQVAGKSASVPELPST